MIRGYPPCIEDALSEILNAHGPRSSSGLPFAAPDALVAALSHYVETMIEETSEAASERFGGQS